jgi:hypothetical protein
LTQNYLDKGIEVENRLASREVINSGYYTLQKRAGYVVARNIHRASLYKRELSDNPPTTPVAKKKKLE